MVTLKVIPVPEHFQAVRVMPQGDDEVLFNRISMVAGIGLGKIPSHRDAALVEAVFGSMFELFPFEVVMQARNFVSTHTAEGQFWWNEDLHLGCVHYLFGLHTPFKQSFWVLPLNRVK